MNGLVLIRDQSTKALLKEMFSHTLGEQYNIVEANPDDIDADQMFSAMLLSFAPVRRTSTLVQFTHASDSFQQNKYKKRNDTATL